MKKLLSLVLVILLTVGCAGAETIGSGLGSAVSSLPKQQPYPGAEHYGANYLEAKLVVEPWPELPEKGIPVFYAEDKCVVLPRRGERFVPFLYDTSAGEITYMYYFEEDQPVWKQMVVDNLVVMLDYTVEEVEALCDPYYMDYYFYIVQGQDTLTSLSIEPKEIVLNFTTASFVVDTRWPALSPVDGIELGGGAGIKWLNDQDADYIYTDADGNETSVHITGDPGYEYVPYCIDFEWDAVAMVVHEARKRGDARFAMGFAGDYTSGEMEFVDLGTYAASAGPTMARLCGRDAALAYNEGSITMYPLLLVRRDGAKALIWDGETMTAVDVNELIGENGTVSMKGYDYRYLYPLNVSDDGRYAAFIEGGNGDLLVMDIETLETKCMMTQAEMEEMGYGNMMNDLNGWFVGDTIMGKNGYDLKFVFE